MTEVTLSTSNNAVARFLRSKAFHLQVDTLEEEVFFRSASEARDRPEPGVTVPPIFLKHQSRPTGPGLLTEAERAFFDHNGDVWVSDEGLAQFTSALLDMFAYAKSPHWSKEIHARFTLPTPGSSTPSVDMDSVLALRNGIGECTLLVFNCSGKVSI
ncbi:hypothetical protein EIP91_004686 [Steccherinum ochraceum]|uniref:Uncharacterized protein n=1 Tax=Steccherinum ochraceum TaxID=92696 RepID=A0A4R0RJQ8_9APHY|nr:hypothetical protein EIP91_004686 [Steccherinum ochraceum]